MIEPIWEIKLEYLRIIYVFCFHKWFFDIPLISIGYSLKQRKKTSICLFWLFPAEIHAIKHVERVQRTVSFYILTDK